MLVEQMRTSAQQQKEQQQGGETAPKQPFADAMAWCTEVTALMATLGGVRILCIEEDELTIGLTTHADLGAGEPDWPNLGHAHATNGLCKIVKHQLTVLATSCQALPIFWISHFAAMEFMPSIAPQQFA